MTRDELVAAAQVGGFNQMLTTTVQRFADEAVREFDAEELWPWRVAEQTGVAPLTVTTLGPVDSVVTSDLVPLRPVRHSELIEGRRDLSEAGNARYYYVQQGVVKTWPTTTLAITVRHYDQGGWQTGDETANSGADTPRADVRWHDAILLLIRLRCMVEDRDWDGATQVFARYQTRLEQARQAELRDNWDEPDVQRNVETH